MESRILKLTPVSQELSIAKKQREGERARRELEELGGVRKTALIQEEASIEDRAAATINRFELPVGTLSAR